MGDSRPADDHPDFVAVDHITVTVQDMAAALHFYTEILGLRLITDVTVEGEGTFGGFAVQEGAVVELGGAAQDDAYDSSHAVRHMVVFERIGGTSLTLISHPGDELKGAPASRLDRLGYTHLAFDVRDLGAFTERMRERGAEPIAPGFYRDPEGNIIQVQESGHADRIHQLYRDRYTVEPDTA